MPRYRVRCEILVDAKTRENAVSYAKEMLCVGLIEYEGNGMVVNEPVLSFNITGTEEIR